MNSLPLPIVGNLTGDPELRFTESGVAVCKFAIAHNPRYFDRESGTWKEGTATYIDCNAWRELAEHVVESLAAGTRVIAYGYLKTREWESDGSGKTAAGEKIRRLTLDVQFIGPELTFATATVKKATRTRSGETAPDDPWATASKQRPAAAAGGFDDEPPF